jgi:hypothetical protein
MDHKVVFLSDEVFDLGDALYRREHIVKVGLTGTCGVKVFSHFQF